MGFFARCEKIKIACIFASWLQASLHLGCKHLCIFSILLFYHVFLLYLKKQKDACIFESWLRASLHLGCGHLLWLMIFATILIAFWLHASFGLDDRCYSFGC